MIKCMLIVVDGQTDARIEDGPLQIDGQTDARIDQGQTDARIEDGALQIDDVHSIDQNQILLFCFV